MNSIKQLQNNTKISQQKKIRVKKKKKIRGLIQYLNNRSSVQAEQEKGRMAGQTILK